MRKICVSLEHRADVVVDLRAPRPGRGRSASPAPRATVRSPVHARRCCGRSAHRDPARSPGRTPARAPHRARSPAPSSRPSDPSHPAAHSCSRRQNLSAVSASRSSRATCSFSALLARLRYAVVVQFGARRGDDVRFRRHLAIAKPVVQRRQQLPQCQVAGGAEHHAVERLDRDDLRHGPVPNHATRRQHCRLVSHGVRPRGWRRRPC